MPNKLNIIIARNSLIVIGRNSVLVYRINLLFSEKNTDSGVFEIVGFYLGKV